MHGKRCIVFRFDNNNIIYHWSVVDRGENSLIAFICWWLGRRLLLVVMAGMGGGYILNLSDITLDRRVGRICVMYYKILLLYFIYVPRRKRNKLLLYIIIYIVVSTWYQLKSQRRKRSMKLLWPSVVGRGLVGFLHSLPFMLGVA